MGKWTLCIDQEDFDFGYPMIYKLDGLPEDFGWAPIQVLFNFRENQKKGLLSLATNSVLRACLKIL